MMKTRNWVIGFVILLLLCGAAWFFMQNGTGESRMTAEIYLNNVLVRTVDLDAVTEAYTFTVDGKIGANVIAVEPGRICVQEADCPDQVCVNQGWQADGVLPIVCLPNKLVIQLTASEGTSADNTAALDGVIQ